LLKKPKTVDGVKRDIIYKQMKLSPALAAICGEKKLTRQEVLKRVWMYIKQRKLQVPVLHSSTYQGPMLRLVYIGEFHVQFCIKLARFVLIFFSLLNLQA
jgi:uncharacterized metal-binding protein